MARSRKRHALHRPTRPWCLGLIMAQKARHVRTNPNCNHIILDRVMGTRDPQRERPRRPPETVWDR